jgi:hypothetical protein
MLTDVACPSEMALTAEQHLQLATAYEKAALVCLIPLEQQTAFSRKANLFRILARLAEKNEQAARSVTVPQELLKSNRSRLGAAFRRLLSFAN